MAFRRLVLVLALLLSPALADRGSLRVDPSRLLSEPFQSAIVAWNDGTELLILETNLEVNEPTETLEFIPFPSEPKITEAKEDCFQVLSGLLKKHEVMFDSSAGMTRGGPGGGRVEILSHQQLGAHDLTVLRVRDSGAVAAWVKEYFKKRGLPVRDLTERELKVIEDYHRRGLEYFVLDFVTLKPGIQTRRPLMYEFKTPRIYYPIKTSNLAEGYGAVQLFLLLDCPPDVMGDVLEKAVEWPIAYFDPEFKPGLPRLALEFMASNQVSLSAEELTRLEPRLGESYSEGATMAALLYRGPLRFRRDAWLSVGEEEEEVPEEKPRDSLLRTPLHRAASAGDLARCKALVSPLTLSQTDAEGMTALHCATEGGHLEVVKFLLKSGAELEAADADGNTALIYALATGSRAVAEALLDAGADVLVTNLDEAGAFVAALQSPHPEALVLAIERAKPQVRELQLGLERVIWNRRANLIGPLVSAGAEVNASHPSGRSPIDRAIEVNSTDCVLGLIDAGLDPNAQNRQKETPLHVAVRRGRLEICRALLEKKADISRRGPKGNTPLHYAAKFNKPEVVKLLLERGADPGLTNAKGKTPREVAGPKALGAFKGQ